MKSVPDECRHDWWWWRTLPPLNERKDMSDIMFSLADKSGPDERSVSKVIYLYDQGSEDFRKGVNHALVAVTGLSLPTVVKVWEKVR